jgi:hypothetical protein
MMAFVSKPIGQWSFEDACGTPVEKHWVRELEYFVRFACKVS